MTTNDPLSDIPPQHDQKFLLRMTSEERWMAEGLARDLGTSLNSALRVCIWRGALQTTGSPTDLAVTDPHKFYDGGTPQLRPIPRTPGQMNLFADDTTTEE